jgi:hypothetical protein
MSYTVVITVTDCSPPNKPIKGAIITDGSSDGTKTTDQKGQASYEVTGDEDDPDLPYTVQVSAGNNYGVQMITLEPGEGSVSLCLPASLGQGSGIPVVPPDAPDLFPNPASLRGPNCITVTWTAPQSYDKYLIWWTQNGTAMPQGEVDTSGRSGSWTTPETIPGFQYTFSIKGGVSAIGGDVYSVWGPISRTTAVPNLNSLVLFLLESGFSLPQQMRRLMAPQTSLRKFMKLA